MVDGRIVTEHGAVLAPGFNPLPVNVTDTVCLGGGDESNLGPGARVLRRDPDVRRAPCEQPQRGATLTGLSTGLAWVCRSCPCNLHQALCHRHGAAPPSATPDFTATLAYLSSVAAEIEFAYTEHLSFWADAWIRKWPAKKQAMIRASVDLDEVRPDRVVTMVKREVYHKAPTKARMIQYYPTLADQARFGPEFYSLQKTYTAWFQRRLVSDGIRVTFASGLNSNALSAWMSEVISDYANPMFYERDGKNWDSTMQEAHLGVRLAAYSCAGDEFRAFVKAGFHVTGRAARGALKYRLRGTVKSGHNDTTLGNSLVNAFIAYESMRELHLRGDILVAGDDLLVVIDGDYDFDKLVAAERRFGIVPEARKFESPGDVSFISGVWLECDSGYLFAPKPGRLLARLFWTTQPPPPGKEQQYLNGIVAGLSPTCSEVPIVRAFLAAHYREGCEAMIRPDWKYRVCLERVGPIPKGLLAPFCRRYGLTLDDVEAVESFIFEHRGKIGLLSHPVLDRVVAVDLADLDARPCTGEL